jgi:two-component system, OmpR family, sensor kinase
MSRLVATTRGRLVAFSLALLLLALLVADGAVLISLSVTESNASDEVLLAQSRIIRATLEDSNGQLSLDAVDIPAETQTGIAVDAAVVGATGMLAHTTAQPFSTQALADLQRRATAAGGPLWANLVDSHGVHRRALAVPLTGSSDPSAVLVVSRSVGEMQTTLRNTFIVLAVVSLLLLVAGGILTHWLAGRALAPVRTIAGLARSISEHDLHRRVDVKAPPDELGELVDTFNSMLARLEASFASLGRFTADASHELRAPLTLMRSEIEGALSRNRSQAEYKRVLNALEGEVDHLSRLADQLLVLARADAGALEPAREPVDVADLLHETAARWEGTAAKNHARIEVDAPISGFLAADPPLLRRVLDNLVDNAVRHAPEGSAISLRGYRSTTGWDLEVADRGPGVPPERRAELFSRFAKSDGARTRDGSGAGLGLALSAAIAGVHGGTLVLVDGEVPGARFRLHLPDQEDGPHGRQPSATGR